MPPKATAAVLLISDPSVRTKVADTRAVAAVVSVVPFGATCAHTNANGAGWSVRNVSALPENSLLEGVGTAKLTSNCQVLIIGF